jgi:hypothetical protein
MGSSYSVKECNRWSAAKLSCFAGAVVGSATKALVLDDRFSQGVMLEQPAEARGAGVTGVDEGSHGLERQPTTLQHRRWTNSMSSRASRRFRLWLHAGRQACGGRSGRNARPTPHTRRAMLRSTALTSYTGKLKVNRLHGLRDVECRKTSKHLLSRCGGGLTK